MSISTISPQTNVCPAFDNTALIQPLSTSAVVTLIGRRSRTTRCVTLRSISLALGSGALLLRREANKLLCDRRSRNVVISTLYRVLGGPSTAKEVFHRLIKDDLAVRKLHVIGTLKPNESLLLSFAYRCLTLQRALVP